MLTHLAYLVQHRVSILGFPEVTIVQKAVMQAKQGENNKKKKQKYKISIHC